MKISNITISGYQGINYLNLDIDKPIVLIAGKNGSGKTTLRDAIQFAITGESSRVNVKKNYPQLVRVGSDSKKSMCSITAGGFTFQRGVATGKAKTDAPDFPEILPLLLGNRSFTEMDDKDKAKTLFSVAGIKRDREHVKLLLEQRKIDPQCIEESITMLRGGFESAEKFCKTKQSEARGSWQAVTGETFGEQKADGWQPPEVQETSTDELADARDRLKRSVPKLNEEIEGMEQKMAELRQHTHSSGLVYECPCCAAKLRIIAGGERGPVLAVDEIGEQPEPPVEEIQNLSKAIGAARSELSQVHNEIARIDAQVQRARDAEILRKEAAGRAAEYFRQYKAWAEAAAAYAPSGIPLQIIESALKPVNDWFKATCEATGWKKIEMSPNLDISYGGITYGLCSESEKWRVDAAIAEAFSGMSGVKLFALDRLDVLHPDDRGPTLSWLISVSNRHDTILVMATLKKAVPADFSPAVMSVWLEQGGEVREAA